MHPWSIHFFRNVASAFTHALGSKASFLAFCISPRFPWIAPSLVLHFYFFLKPGGLSMYSNSYIFAAGLSQLLMVLIAKPNFPISPSVYLLQHDIIPKFLGWHSSGRILRSYHVYIQGLSQSVRNILSYLSIRRRVFPWKFSLFSLVEGPRVALSLLFQSESKCLVHNTDAAVSLSRMPSPEAEMLRIFGMPVNCSVSPSLDYLEGDKGPWNPILPRIGDIYTFGRSRGFS